MWQPIALIILYFSLIVTTQAAEQTPFGDLEREKRLADEAEAGLFIGDPVYLQTNQQEFLGVYTEAETDTIHGAVLVLHGRGLHPNWPEVISPLRNALAESGWHNLSIQLPVLHKQATYYDYLPLFPAASQRIKRAIDYLHEQDIEKIVLIAHSCGVHMSMAYIDEFGADEFSAYIGIGMGATDAGQTMEKPYPIDQMTIPVLEVYGVNDYPSVLRTAAERAEVLQNHTHPKTKQLAIADADHYFKDDGLVDVLSENIMEWLQE